MIITELRAANHTPIAGAIILQPADGVKSRITICCAIYFSVTTISCEGSLFCVMLCHKTTISCMGMLGKF